MEDSEAVARVKSGDRDAYRLLVERHGRAVFRLAYRMTGNEEDSEDVVQDTFLRAYRQLHRWESRSSFATWLYRIAANASLDVIRRRQRAKERILIEESNEPGPERLLLSGEVQERVAQTLGELSEQERVAFVLRHFEGQSIEEIGAALGLSGTAAKHSVFRAVKKLRRALQPLVRTAS